MLAMTLMDTLTSIGLGIVVGVLLVRLVRGKG